jgi:hypothetical protein
MVNEDFERSRMVHGEGRQLSGIGFEAVYPRQFFVTSCFIEHTATMSILFILDS